METFIPNCFGTPTDLTPPKDDLQLAQINIVQQAFKEQEQSKNITVQWKCTIIIIFTKIDEFMQDGDK